MKTWLKIGIIILILIVLINIISFYNSYFSVTYGKVLDSEGKGIPGARVDIHYLCKNFISFETRSAILSIKNTITDSNGEFRFESYLGRPNLLSCEKYLFSFKDGYCKNIGLCSSEISSGGFTSKQVAEIDKPNYILYNGTYYDPYYFQDQIKIKSKDKYPILKLNKL